MFFYIMEVFLYFIELFYQVFLVVGIIFDSCFINLNINSLKVIRDSVVDMI